MVRRITATARFLTWVLALGLAVVSSATCLLGAEMSQAQKACCAGMNHDCGTAAAIEQDCCAAEALALTSFAPGTVVSPLAVPAPATAALIVPGPDFATPLTASGFDIRASSSSRRPTYLLVSVFRL